MSPNFSMNFSKSGSWPSMRWASISFSAFIMSFMRAMSPSDMRCTICFMSLKKDSVTALRSCSSSLSNFSFASGDRNS